MDSAKGDGEMRGGQCVLLGTCSVSWLRLSPHRTPLGLLGTRDIPILAMYSLPSHCLPPNLQNLYLIWSWGKNSGSDAFPNLFRSDTQTSESLKGQCQKMAFDL